MERRRQPRKRPFATQPAITVWSGAEKFEAKIKDWSDGGFGLEMRQNLDPGCRVRLEGLLAQGASLKKLDVYVRVRWCVAGPNGSHLCGVAFEHASSGSSDSADRDCYEVLQLSPNADPDTIHRVFRVLAQRLHPDNRETGDEARFKALVQAYDVISNPERRAAYDARRPSLEQRWKIFDSAAATVGIEAERRKRHGILSLLYTRRVNDTRDPSMPMHDLERLLGCPREHLEFALWYLKENGWVTRSDNGRFTISVQGVDQAELLGEYAPQQRPRIAAGPSKVA